MLEHRMYSQIMRSRATLWQPKGEGHSGRLASHLHASSSRIFGSTATFARSPGGGSHTKHRSCVLCEYNGGAYEREQSGSRRVPTVEERRRPQSDYDFPPPSGSYRPPPNSPPGPPDGGGSGNDNLKNYLIAAAFFIGMGTGVWFDTNASFTPSNVASTEIIDRKTPNSELCMANGFSSMVFDQRIFVSFNPFNVYVAQPEVKPGCVVRQSNVNLLEKRKLVSDKEVSACTRSSNTFAFVGDLDKSPEVSCVYHSEEAENQFLRNPKRAVLGDGYRPTGDSNPGASKSVP